MLITFNADTHEVKLTAQGAEEVKALYKKYMTIDIDDPESLKAYAEAIAAQTFDVVFRNNKRPWHRVEASIDRRFLVPYLQQLEKITGFKVDRFPDVVIEQATHNQYQVTEVFEVKDDQFHFITYHQSEPWNGMSAQEYATRIVCNYFAELVAHRPPVEEYIQSGNGSYIRNPKYATGFKHPLQPRVKHAGLWLALWEWWLTNHATKGQRDVVQRVKDGFPKRRSYDRHPWELGYHGIDWQIYVPDENGDVDWDGKGHRMNVMRWEEFAKL